MGPLVECPSRPLCWQVVGRSRVLPGARQPGLLRSSGRAGGDRVANPLAWRRPDSRAQHGVPAVVPALRDRGARPGTRDHQERYGRCDRRIDVRVQSVPDGSLAASRIARRLVAARRAAGAASVPARRACALAGAVRGVTGAPGAHMRLLLLLRRAAARRVDPVVRPTCAAHAPDRHRLGGSCAPAAAGTPRLHAFSRSTEPSPRVPGSQALQRGHDGPDQPLPADCALAWLARGAKAGGGHLHRRLRDRPRRRRCPPVALACVAARHAAPSRPGRVPGAGRDLRSGCAQRTHGRVESADRGGEHWGA